MKFITEDNQWSIPNVDEGLVHVMLSHVEFLNSNESDYVKQYHLAYHSETGLFVYPIQHKSWTDLSISEAVDYVSSQLTEKEQDYALSHENAFQAFS